LSPTPTTEQKAASPYSMNVLVPIVNSVFSVASLVSISWCS
jgi:hypothetical protein